MQDWNVFDVIGEILEQEIPLVDRMLLSKIAKIEKMTFTISETESEVVQSYAFCKANWFNYYYIQNGEILTIEHIDPTKIFIGYSKFPEPIRSPFSNNSVHKLIAYKPT